MTLTKFPVSMMRKYSSRWGYVRIPSTVPNEIGAEGCSVHGRKWKEVSELMRRVFVVEARPSPINDDILYLCISPFFDELEEGANPPEYEAWFEIARRETDGEEVVEFKRFERLGHTVIQRDLRW